MIKAGIIGATGYAGAELLRLLLSHPEANVEAVSSVSYEGKLVSDVYQSFHGVYDKVLLHEDEVISQSDVIFAALPSGLSVPLAKKIMEKGKKYIDIGGDLRLQDNEVRKAHYQIEDDDIVKRAVYGLPEIFRDQIKGADIIANPGCYPTCAALGLYPALKNDIISTKGIIIDAKSGVTGAGRGLSLTTHFSEVNEALAPYKIGSHRHAPEINQTLCAVAKETVGVMFVPHLVPVNRGILETIYVDFKDGKSYGNLRAAYEKAYGDEVFIDLLPEGKIADLKDARYSNRCVISLHYDKNAQKAVIVSVIDNMVKGAAGQAIQNMNLMFGVPEGAGLPVLSPAF